MITAITKPRLYALLDILNLAEPAETAFITVATGTLRLLARRGQQGREVLVITLTENTKDLPARGDIPTTHQGIYAAVMPVMFARQDITWMVLFARNTKDLPARGDTTTTGDLENVRLLQVPAVGETTTVQRTSAYLMPVTLATSTLMTGRMIPHTTSAITRRLHSAVQARGRGRQETNGVPAMP